MENVDFNLVIDFLRSEEQKLVERIKADNGSDQRAINLKAQISKAIKTLRLCNEFQIDYKATFKTIEEGGSEAYFTDFYLVDEAEIDKIDDWAIKKSEGKPLIISCFDLIASRK